MALQRVTMLLFVILVERGVQSSQQAAEAVAHRG